MDISDGVIRSFTDTFTGELADEVASRLTCSETNVFADLLLAMGREDLASVWIGAHASAADSDEDCDHYAQVIV